MKTNKEIATLFSGGKFKEVAGNLSPDVEWHIYENDLHVAGKTAVLEFGEKVAEYFKSLTTKFELFGMLEDDQKVSIYGKAAFIKEGKTISTVHSCDIYEFDKNSAIKKIYSYCNTSKPAEDDKLN